MNRAQRRASHGHASREPGRATVSATISATMARALGVYCDRVPELRAGTLVVWVVDVAWTGRGAVLPYALAQLRAHRVPEVAPGWFATVLDPAAAVALLTAMNPELGARLAGEPPDGAECWGVAVTRRGVHLVPAAVVTWAGSAAARATDRRRGTLRLTSPGGAA